MNLKTHINPCLNVKAGRKFINSNKGDIARDRDGALVYLAESAWALRYKSEKFPNVRFSATRERGV